jgi:hypothetical protein
MRRRLDEQIAAIPVHVVAPRHAGEPQELVVNQCAVGAQALILVGVRVLTAAHRIDKRNIFFSEGLKAHCVFAVNCKLLPIWLSALSVNLSCMVSLNVDDETAR